MNETRSVCLKRSPLAEGKSLVIFTYSISVLFAYRANDRMRWECGMELTHSFLRGCSCTFPSPKKYVSKVRGFLNIVQKHDNELWLWAFCWEQFHALTPPCSTSPPLLPYFCFLWSWKYPCLEFSSSYSFAASRIFNMDFVLSSSKFLQHIYLSVQKES